MPSLAASLTGRLADTALGIFLTTGRVTAVERPTANFTRVDLAADGFRSASWVPGNKLQLRPQSGTFGLRTYTPTPWDPTVGTTSILAYAHGEGPGAEWFRTVASGDPCEVFGPRRSLDLGGLAHPTLFVGDETSIGLAVALAATSPGLGVTHVLEAHDVAETREVLSWVGLEATVVAKADGTAALLEAVEGAVAGYGASGYDVVLSGDAATVAAVRRRLRDLDRPPTASRVKAYWAEGRTGLD